MAPGNRVVVTTPKGGEWQTDEKLNNPFTVYTLHEMKDSHSWRIFCQTLEQVDPGVYLIFVTTDVDVKCRKWGDGRIQIKNVRSKTFGGL